MSSNGFINKYLDNANTFYHIALQQFKFYKKLEGTKVVVSRISNSSKYKEVFGTTYSSTLMNDNEKSEFEYVIIINMNDMKKLYQKNIDQLQFMDNQDTIKLGDVLTYTRKTQEYKFKVTDVQTFSEAEGVLYQYTIAGMTETNQTL
jgi:hypothetical protein